MQKKRYLRTINFVRSSLCLSVNLPFDCVSSSVSILLKLLDPVDSVFGSISSNFRSFPSLISAGEIVPLF